MLGNPRASEKEKLRKLQILAQSPIRTRLCIEMPCFMFHACDNHYATELYEIINSY